MDSADAKVLAELMKDNTTVQQLHAQNNGLGPEGAKSFGNMLEHNSTLTLLNVSDNQMKAEGAAALADGLKANSTGQQLQCILQQPRPIFQRRTDQAQAAAAYPEHVRVKNAP
jgi:Ran GTPase-activating protein (RanGAP) involved in mRNA processing and transport